MKRARWLVALLGLAFTGPDLRAQFPFFWPSPPVEGFTTNRAVGFTRLGRRSAFSAYLSNSYSYGYYPPYPWYGGPFNRVFVFNYSAPPVVVTPPVVVVQAPAAAEDRDDGLRPARRRWEDRDNRDQFDVIMPRRRPAEPAEGHEPAMPGDQASVFRPVGPEDRARARQVNPPEAPAPPPQPQPAQAPPARPQPPAPRKGVVSELVQGERAFAVQEYGRAERLLRQATIAKPDDARAFFLLAQAQFALAKYQEAVVSIQAGLRLQPDWPRARFQPRDLYGPHAGDFPEQLQHLEGALGRHPDDPDLLFLRAYQLWFDGRREEARKLFEQARPLAPDKTFIDRFLRAGAGVAVVSK
jgi:hypothetical protein